MKQKYHMEFIQTSMFLYSNFNSCDEDHVDMLVHTALFEKLLISAFFSNINLHVADKDSIIHNTTNRYTTKRIEIEHERVEI